MNFIVRAVDEVLQSEFGLPDGLADTSTVTLVWDTGQTDRKGKAITIRKEVHRVQILDPATGTGTGTFLAEAIKQIAPRVKGLAEGMWSGYIERDLIPRLHGFELLMASYAMCHMKLDMILTELGYKPTGAAPRFSVYLTNSLEEAEPVDQTLPFAQWLSNEVKQANTVKRDMPIMCVIGNPPYNVSSQNMGNWIRNLIRPYKDNLDEKKINLDEDYIKFIRFAEYLIEKNGEGIVGFVTSNSFLSGVTHRKMREHLLTTFAKIYIIDLHGDSNKFETAPDGSKDENVFDIKQGVSIILLVRRTANRTQGEIFHSDLFGLRATKNDCLLDGTLASRAFTRLNPAEPYFFFGPFTGEGNKKYESGFKITDLFLEQNTGIQTKRDALCLRTNDSELDEILRDFRKLDNDQLRKKYKLVEDNRDWSIDGARADLLEHSPKVIEVLHRPFDVKKTFYTGRSKGFLGYPRDKTMRHMLLGRNLALLTGRQNKSGTVDDCLVTNLPSEMKAAERTIQSYHFPLYLYPTDQDLHQTRRVNFDTALYKRLQSLGKHARRGTPDELAVFDYIYGALHCPAYRAAYAEFLKIDFPRIPWPTSPDGFWDVAGKGNQLRRLHLMDFTAIGPTPYPFKGEGNGVVDKPRFQDGKVWINDSQYFDAAPEASWDFYIGGYQPAQKWLKDRRGRDLSFDDVKHYQRILKILSETDRIMSTIIMNLDADYGAE